jgi:transcriptional regulator with XRE-family HTH domain
MATKASSVDPNPGFRSKRQKNKKPKESTVPLREFGTTIAKVRTKCGFTQTGLADVMGLSQSYIGLLENGGVTNPDYALLEALRDALNTKCELDKNADKRSSREGVTVELLVAALIQDKYKIAPEIASLLTMPVCDLKQLANWERDLTADDLWIVAPNFVDVDDPDIRDALAARLRAGTVVTFFVGSGDTNFLRLKIKLSTDLANDAGWEKCLRSEPLGEVEMGWISSSFVISNPSKLVRWARLLGLVRSALTDDAPIAQATNVEPSSAQSARPNDAEGYTIVSEDGKPKYGFKMSIEELLARTVGVYHWITANDQRRARYEQALKLNAKKSSGGHQRTRDQRRPL